MARSYSNEEILAMQKDAIRRVNEMRRMSEEKPRQTAPPVQEEPKSSTGEGAVPPKKNTASSCGGDTGRPI